MRLSKAAVLAVRGGGTELKDKIAVALGVSLATVYRWLSDNDDNLTKAASIKVIREETGLPDSEIIDESETEKANA